MTEIRIEDELAVGASPEVVWNAIKDPAVHAGWHPFVTRIEGDHRLGATRSCHVDLGRKMGETTELCIADEEGQRIAWRIEDDTTGFLRLVSDWTAGFRLEPRDSGGTLVTAESAFRPKNVVARLLTPIVRRKFHQAQQAILAGLKRATDDRSGTERSGK
jgi:uncharacterized protein YndB with AHSA1/START domain